MAALCYRKYEADNRVVFKKGLFELDLDLRHQVKLLQKQIDSFKEVHAADLAEVDHTLEEFEKTQAKVSKSADVIQKVLSTKNLTNAIYQRTQR